MINKIMKTKVKLRKFVHTLILTTMKTFKDLKFKHHDLASGMLAVETFNNGYGISVLSREDEDTYECCVLFDNIITYNPDLGTASFVYLSESEVSEIMIKVQSLK